MPERVAGRVKKNVLQLIPSFHQGGSERQALQLVRVLQADGRFNVHLACLKKEGVLLDDLDPADRDALPSFPLTSFFTQSFALQIRRFADWVKDRRVDIIQTHDFYTNIFGMLGSRITKVPVRIAAKRETGMRTAAQNFIERRAFGLATSVAVNSKGVARYLTDAGVDPAKLRLVYNGLDLDRFDGTGQERAGSHQSINFGLSPDRRYIAIVANLREKVKNHEMFLRAAKRVAARVPDVDFVIAGEGERTGLITQFAIDLGLGERTHFLGRCRNIPALLASVDVCALTSDSEGFSNSILEYMAAGKPVVATDVGGASEAIVDGDTGFLVERDDDETMADRICRLLTDECMAARFGQAGRQRVAEHFSVARQLERTVEIYEQESERAQNARSRA